MVSHDTIAVTLGAQIGRVGANHGHAARCLVVSPCSIGNVRQAVATADTLRAHAQPRHRPPPHVPQGRVVSFQSPHVPHRVTESSSYLMPAMLRLRGVTIQHCHVTICACQQTDREASAWQCTSGGTNRPT